MGYPKPPTLFKREPIGVSPGEAAELASVSRSIIFRWLRNGEVASKLVDGRRIVDFQSLKRKLAPDKIRVGVHNPKNDPQAA